jgi:hypothetical protein
MGWTWTHKPKHLSAVQFLRKEFSGPRHEILTDAFVERSEYYALMKMTHADGVGVSHGVVVCLVQFANSDFNIGYKDMSDRCGPNNARCPERILDLADKLDPLHPTGEDKCEDWAANWRKRCREYHRRRRLVVDGAVLKFKNAIRFTDGSEYCTFMVVKKDRRTRFAPIEADGGIGYPGYRISRITEREFEVLPGSN